MTTATKLSPQTDVIRHGLNAAAYRSQDVWEAECRTVFAKNWVFIGFAHEIATPGDAYPVVIAGQPLVMLRGTDNTIQVFHNVCSHRCLTLVDEPKNVGKLLRCPYHAWAYNLKGELKAAPHFAGTGKQECEGFALKDHGLRAVRTHVWHDWIFVNISGDAPAFEDYAASLIARLDGIDFSKLKPVAMIDFSEVATNWKFIMENFIEPYHVQFVHSTTTSQPLEDHYTIIDGNCIGSAVDLDGTKARAGSLSVSSRYLALYPSFIVGRYFPDQMGVYLNIPISADKMLQRRAIYTTEGQHMSDTEVEALKKLWWDVHKEDHEMVERMFQGRASPVADDGGLLSPVWEDSVRAFQDLVTEDLQGDTSNQRGVR